MDTKRITTHNLGYPRIGARRELKFALEDYWRGELDAAGLEAAGHALRERHWREQRAAGMDWVPVGDFSLYDHVADTTLLLGAAPARFGAEANPLEGYFRMARGRAHDDDPGATPALEMTKWFDTNYHYLVPELHSGQSFRLHGERLFAQVREAQALGLDAKPVILGPLTWLWLGKMADDGDRLALLDALLPVYGELLAELARLGCSWVQIDEPILVLDLPPAWKQAFETAYHRLQTPGLKSLLTTYFGDLGDNTALACRLPVDGLHIDLARAPDQLTRVLDHLPAYRQLSLGVVDGRNVWRCDLEAACARIGETLARRPQGLWLAPSCSLLHVPQDLDQEPELDGELRTWLAFARQKLDEVGLLARLASTPEPAPADAAALHQGTAAFAARLASPRIHRPEVTERLASLPADIDRRRHPFAVRKRAQQARLGLPLLPTTTIGSFPQTAEIRRTRQAFKQGRISKADYEAAMQASIRETVERQEALGLDVLVHGEPERNDMVEYFGEQLEGYAFTRHGWVQSYGSRCVKPPIIYGDVRRPAAMTVAWSHYAQSLTDRPMKGMLTGPVTMLQWSFVRDDQPRARTCEQIALALRDEVCDLEAAGIGIIQIDEPALREGLPLRRQDWASYLDWAVRCFRITASGVADDTQIHTHMCYAEFNDIIEAIAALDADVITIEASRSDMALLEAFEDFAYPNDIGPGVYDIHTPNVPTVDEIRVRLEKALARIPAERLWVNPDCGLKTRGWPEVEAALRAMVTATNALRGALGDAERQRTA